MPEDEPWFRQEGDRFSVHLSGAPRTLLIQLCRESRALLESEDPSSDPAVARLFPPAYPDDPLRNLEFETNLGAAPRNGKLQALEVVERTALAEQLTEEQLLAWIGVVNDIRLVLGTRIEISEDRTDEDYPHDDPRHVPYQVFLFLNELMYEMLAAVGAPGDPDPEDEERGPEASVERD